MGMYLGLYKLKDRSEHPDYDKVPDEIFDMGKYVGDSEYAAAAYVQGFEREYIGCDTAYCCVTIYWRPKEFDKERAWLRKTRKIPKWNRERLLKVLDLVEKDKDLYFEFS